MITINNLDYAIHDVAFEGFVLNYYGNFGNLIFFFIFACQCHKRMRDFKHECHPKWGIGDIAQQKIYSREPHVNQKLYHDASSKMAMLDLDVCIHFNNLTLVDVLSYENLIFHYVQTDTITSFHKFLHEIIATTTIAILMIGVQGEIDGNI
jgi:hypothetical protein